MIIKNIGNIEVFICLAGCLEQLLHEHESGSVEYSFFCNKSILIDFNGTQTHYLLVSKGTLNHLVKKIEKILASLAKWLSVCLQTKWQWVRVPLQSLKL